MLLVQDAGSRPQGPSRLTRSVGMKRLVELLNASACPVLQSSATRRSDQQPSALQPGQRGSRVLWLVTFTTQLAIVAVATCCAFSYPNMTGTQISSATNQVPLSSIYIYVCRCCLLGGVQQLLEACLCFQSLPLVSCISNGP